MPTIPQPNPFQTHEPLIFVGEKTTIQYEQIKLHCKFWGISQKQLLKNHKKYKKLYEESFKIR